jgi:outer membrane murein-binding lipoprotein Lpp
MPRFCVYDSGGRYPEDAMTKSTLFDRLNQELEAFGKKAQAALDEGKLQIELLRVRRRRDNTARDLGLLIHRRERGGVAEQRRVDALLVRLDELEAEIARLEQQVSEARRPPAPAPVEGNVAAPGATM